MNARACSAHPAAKRAPAENGHAPTTDAGSRSAFTRTLRAHDWLNFFLADVQTGVGPFLAIYLAGRQWDEERVGLALTVGGIAGVVAQTPAGALVDLLSSKRGLVASGVRDRLHSVYGSHVVSQMAGAGWPPQGDEFAVGWEGLSEPPDSRPVPFDPEPR
jgi:hypothetical protein